MALQTGMSVPTHVSKALLRVGTEPGVEGKVRGRPGPGAGIWRPAPPKNSVFEPGLSGCYEGIFVKGGD